MNATRGMQIKIYFRKCFRIFRNEQGWKIFISSAIITAIIALVASDGMFVYDRATENGAFALLCACIWIGIFNSIQSICKERDIIKREHRTGLLMSSYVLAHLLYDMVLCFIEAVIVSFIFFLSTASDFPDGGAFFGLLFTFFLTILCADALGLMVSAIVKTTNTAMTVMPFVLIVQLVMSGQIFTFEDSSFSGILSFFTISRWSQHSICSLADVNALSSAPGVPAVVKEYDGILPLMWLLLLVFTAIYTAIAIYSLQFIDRDKR